MPLRSVSPSCFMAWPRRVGVADVPAEVACRPLEGNASVEDPSVCICEWRRLGGGGGGPLVSGCEILSKDLPDDELNAVVMLWLVEGNGL